MSNSLFNSATVCDLTLPFEQHLEGREEVIDRYWRSGISFVSLSVGSDRNGAGATVHNIANVRELIASRCDKITFARGVEDIRKAKRHGLLAVGFNFQGSQALEANPNLVGLYYELGVRHMLLVYNQMNAAAGGCHERIDAGLSRYGLRLIQEMNRVGMLVDCMHTGYRSTIDIMEASSAPVIFSHSNSRAIRDHERNISDEQAKRCASTGGVIGITGIGKFLSDGGTPEVSDVMAHIIHFASLIGPEHIALGIDYVYFAEQHYRNARRNLDKWPPKSYPPPPWHYFAPEQVPALSEGLSEHGFSEADVKGILGENCLRVATRVWK